MRGTIKELQMLKFQADQLEEAARVIRRNMEFEIAARELDVQVNDALFIDTFSTQLELSKSILERMHKFIFSKRV